MSGISNDNDEHISFDKVLSDKVLFDLMVNKISDHAIDKMEAGVTRSRQRFAAFLTVGAGIFIAAVTGVGQLTFKSFESSIRSEMTASERDSAVTAKQTAIEEANKILDSNVDKIIEEVAREARSALEEQVEREMAVLRAEWDKITNLLRLKSITTSMEIAGGFSQKEADNAIEMLRYFAENNSYLEYSEFPIILENVIDHFFEADRTDLIYRLEPLFGDVMLSHQG